MPSKPIAIYHEHPDWFRPLFSELERRGVPFVRLDPKSHRFDPSEQGSPYSLVFNRMSPSAYLRGGVQGMFYTAAWLAHLDRLGVPVVNGTSAFGYEVSKARQLTLLESLGIKYPRSVVVNHASQVVTASAGMRFPVVVKANVGGSGAGITKFDSAEALASAAEVGGFDFGVDHTALVQEFVPARGGSIVRVETLGGRVLYAIRVHLTGESFNLCPADICRRADGVELVRGACAVDAVKSGLRVEAHAPSREVATNCEALMRAAGIHVGGIEIMQDDRDGEYYYYDINALSNFVADAVNVVGFEPVDRLADYLVERARAGSVPPPEPVSQLLAAPGWDS